MGEPGVDSKKGPQVGAATSTTGGPLGAPGKTTLVGGVDDAAPSSRNDPAVRPPEYAAMDADCLRLLVASRATLVGFAGKPDPFWDLVDQQLNARQLHALTQTVNGARHA